MKLYNDYANNNDPKSNIGGSKQAIHQFKIVAARTLHYSNIPLTYSSYYDLNEI